jgi:hypothetical protein
MMLIAAQSGLSGRSGRSGSEWTLGNRLSAYSAFAKPLAQQVLRPSAVGSSVLFSRPFAVPIRVASRSGFA